MKIFYFFIFIYFSIINSSFSNDTKHISYPFTAKELVFECEAWIPGETAAQQEAKREYPCIRFIQSSINTYQLIRSENINKLPDLCLSNVLNLQRHKDVFIKYVKTNPGKNNLDASKVLFESLIDSYCK
ncbi:MAG: hypothetical protein CFH28_00428 [Alphaproteobacteria bacterium MarineAlpha6_Bin6]|nr:hypothetical protein [Pelagibacteraceae bacterium]PPR31685.1 MAG: hypothetical protein CFH28_00428 [Alphaproteobacteria bacterium MarineAlpha6_Bin6]PPR33589.1 MAG: hypothetical protein CFH27_00549 [Alphaproteobacteria bacterium MarineAlpha6_Bin5]|tara:strand:+ start:448 stop:834 length:387 start_codon:yes stop_codon:yes gene_type:complete